MTDLYRVTVAELLEAADRLQAWTQAGLDPAATTWPIAATLSNDLLARDESGAHWLYAPHAQRWYRHTAAGWQRVSHPPSGPLEAPASPALLSDRQTADALAAFDPSDNPVALSTVKGPALSAAEGPTANPTPHEGISHAIAGLRDAYAQGRLSSDDATEIAARMALLDRQGCFWMPGFWSGEWHRFHAGDWHEAEPPAIDTLVRLDEGPRPCDNCGAQLDSGLICPACGEAVPPTVVSLEPPGAPLPPEQAGRVLMGVAAYMIGGLGTIPEPVTAEWDPPTDRPQKSTPESIACPACDHANPLASRFCNACGQPLVPPPAACIPPPPQPESACCALCGAPLAPEQAFCSQCGQPVPSAQEASPPRFCPSCGEPAEPGQAFCAHCGQSLRSS